MERFFYTLVLLFVIWEVWKFIEIDYILREIRIYKKLKEESKKAMERAQVPTCPMLLMTNIDLLYLIVCCVGLFSSQGLGFLSLMILSFFPHDGRTWRRVDSILSILILIWIFTNKYYIHWDGIQFNLYTYLFQ